MTQRYRVKPSKGQSMFGFIVGLMFVVLGFVLVVPTFGGFGIIWLLVSIGITIMHGINAFSEKGVATHQVDVQSSKDIMDQEGGYDQKIRQLHKLMQDGIISETEYESKKRELLNEQW
ncbi:putative oligomerization/nucleic acid binding protein [Streptohalobacillus salinus]|uniref:Putative oligomerization/nucleic acid binding protein n=1 Tax=Streptohalobacillus salinus TaxID=621096 RepID=A0A2V3WKI3_9BACI|nr:SHOCT domain-containing protein [Streptohalobacillus salinus]PXW93188.1 putative oligomerization/nucleic acid binding protein [Streptohalobacillus salinus]